MIQITPQMGILLAIEPVDFRNYPKQKILYVVLDDYVYLVPTVEAGDVCFLKTIFPDRKATKRFHEESESDASG